MVDLCYCALGVWSERSEEPEYARYWIELLGAMFRGHARSAKLSRDERRLAVTTLATIELIFVRHFRESGDEAAALRAQRLLLQIDSERERIAAAIDSAA